MEPKHFVVVTLVLALASCAASAQWKNTPLEAPAQRNPQLYDTKADARKEISEAKLAAARKHKRVLLVFGGNWCLDCHVLDHAFHQPRIAPLVNSNFIVVHIDVGEYTRNLDLAQKYHVDLKKGVPEIAVLDTNGTFLYSTSQFEKTNVLTQEDVISFLEKWKPQRTAAKS